MQRLFALAASIVALAAVVVAPAFAASPGTGGQPQARTRDGWIVTATRVSPGWSISCKLDPYLAPSLSARV